MKKSLPNVTLIGVDCVDFGRLQLAADICEKDFTFGAVKLLTSLPNSDPRAVRIPPVRSTAQYSKFCIAEMARHIDTPFALIIQHDGFILNPAAWSDDFLHYDYIGAPWYHLGPVRVGNGGFSLRSKRLLDYIAAHHQDIGGALDPEDIWICQAARPALEEAGMSFAPEAVAERFSKEGDHHSVVWNGEFGFHGIKYTDISAWLDLHPEYAGSLTYELDDYAKLMKRRHPVWDGTFHTLRYRTMHMEAYRALARGVRDYDARMEEDLDEEVLPGHTAIFKRSGVSFKKVPIPAFEQKIKAVEHFPDKKSLLAAHPGIQITYPTKLPLPKLQKFFIRLLGNAACPSNKPYTLLRFEK